jgi:hypothetical protein
VATESNVLASLDRNTGVSNWRVLLPSHVNSIGKTTRAAQTSGYFFLIVERMIVMDKSVVALAHAGNSVEHILVAWNLHTGVMEWETFLPSDSLASSGNMKTDLLYDSSYKRVHVLANNCVAAVSKLHGGAFIGAPVCGSSLVYSPQRDTDVGTTFYIAQLTLPLTAVGLSSAQQNAKQGLYRVAVGCAVQTDGYTDSVGYTCAYAPGFVLSASPNEFSGLSVETVRLHADSAPFAVAADTLVSTLSQSAVVTESDVIVGFEKTASVVKSVSFVTGSSVSVSPSVVPEDYWGQYVTSLNLAMTTEEDIVPVISVCSSRSCLISEMVNRDDALVPSFEACASDKNADPYNYVVTAHSQYVTISSLSSHLSCVIASSASTVFKQFSFTGQGYKKTAVESKLMNKQQYLLGQTGFTFGTLDSASSSCQGIVVTRTGMTLCVGPAQATKSTAAGVMSIIWARDEAFANLHESIPFELTAITHTAAQGASRAEDVAQVDLDEAVVGEDTFLVSVPDFKTRLALQQIELKVASFDVLSQHLIDCDVSGNAGVCC